MLISRRCILWSTGVFAVLIRTFFFYLVLGSAFRFYHLVPGLDMQTLLRFSEWGSAAPETLPLLTPHRLLIYLLWKAGGGVHQVPWLFGIQALFGILGVLALTDMLLMLTGRRLPALAAGLLWACYLPELLFEHSVLQDSLSTSLILLALWSTLYARKKRFAPFPTICSALLWGCALLGRPTALFLTGAVTLLLILYLKRRKGLKKILYFIIPLLLFLGAAGCFNFAFRRSFSPFFNVMPYTIQYNAEIGDQYGIPSFLNAAGQALRRVPKLLSCRELPDNQNSAFWREKLSTLQSFPGETLLMPLGAAGLVLLLLSGRSNRREMLIWYPLLFLALPLCAREPVNRYRLILTPYLLMALVLGISLWLTLRPPLRRTLTMTVALLAGVLLAINTVPEKTVRDNDYLSWALALENSGQAETEEILNAYYEFWRAANFSSGRSFRIVAAKALQYRHYGLFHLVTIQAAQTRKVDPSLIHFYTGMRLVDNNDFDGVLREFSMVDPASLSENDRKIFFRVRSDAERLSYLLHNRQKGVILK